MPEDLSFSLLPAAFSLSLAGSSHSSRWDELPFEGKFSEIFFLL